MKEEWNINYFISGHEKNAGGVLIAIDNNFEWKIHEQIIGKEGRYIIIDLEIQDIARFLLINLYAPNDDSPTFFENIFNEVENMDIKNLIITGDWNLINDFEKDTFNYKKLNNPKAQQIVTEYKNKLDLIDIWRQAHPDDSKFTLRQMYYNKMARLDFFLISEPLLDIYGDSSIKNCYRSDHSPINLKLITSKHKKGQGNWKLNNSLLSDPILQKKIEEEIELIICTYACTPYNQEYVKKTIKIKN